MFSDDQENIEQRSYESNQAKLELRILFEDAISLLINEEQDEMK